MLAAVLHLGTGIAFMGSTLRLASTTTCFLSELVHCGIGMACRISVSFLLCVCGLVLALVAGQDFLRYERRSEVLGRDEALPACAVSERHRLEGHHC